MKFADYVDKYGVLPTFHIEDEINSSSLDKNKPSSRIFYSKQGLKAIAALKNIERDNNHSWYQELLNRNKDNMNETALFYRGRKITFQEMFNNSDKLAKSLYSEGIRKGDEIPACLANTPETVYLLLAVNKIGAKANLFGADFAPEYLNTILNDCTDKVFFATDSYYSEIESKIGNRKYKSKVLFSLADSLPKKPEECPEYEPSLASYYHYENIVNNFKKNDSSIVSIDEFNKLGENSNQNIIDDNNLETPFLVTYTSGSTSVGSPKAIIHCNRSLIGSGLFHDPELSGNPKIPGLRGLAHIHTESNTDVITCISDNLMQGYSVAMEPEYDKNKLLDYLLIDSPNYANITTSFLINAAKQYLIEKKYHQDGIGRKFPSLLAVFAVGENTSIGEEKFINKFLREAKAGSGVKIKVFKLPYTTLCIGGGDCEHGGIYYTLWKSTMEKLNKLKLRNKPFGMKPESYVQLGAFRPIDGNLYKECDYDEIGIIAANSYTNMKGYKNDKTDLKETILTDTKNRDWLSSNVYGYIDKMGCCHIKGRVGNEIRLANNKLIAPYSIEDIVSADTKNILSCSVTHTNDGNYDIPIVNIAFQPFKTKNDSDAIISTYRRCQKELPIEATENMLFRILTDFPLKPSGKRDTHALQTYGINDTYKVVNNKLIPCDGTSLDLTKGKPKIYVKK